MTYRASGPIMQVRIVCYASNIDIIYETEYSMG